MKKISLKLIKFYQKLFSPDHGLFKKAFPSGFCRFYPTCSEYTYQSIERFGFIKGSSLGFWRILRCNPFSKGGQDLVPKKIRNDYFIYGFLSIIVYTTIITSLVIFLIKEYHV